MVRPLRIDAPGELFHVLARGNARQDVFVDLDDRIAFLQALSETLERFGLACHGYCLMGNHYHLLVQPIRRNLSGAMRHLNSLFAQRFNRRRGRVGHVFGGRFKSLLVDRDPYFLELLRYLALNPVRAGLVARAEQWPWSSHRALAGLEPPAPFLATAFVWRAFDSTDARRAQSSYRRFVELGATESLTTELETLAERGGIVGGERFIERFARELDSARSEPEFARRDRIVARPTLRSIFAEATSRAERDGGIRSACLRWGYSGSEVACHLGVSRTTVSRAVRSTRAGASMTQCEI